MILVGSRPIANILNRKPKDWDFLCRSSEYDRNIIVLSTGEKIEFQKDWSSSLLIENRSKSFMDTPMGYIKCATPELSFILKKSHLYRELNWYKHIKDFHKLWAYLKETLGVSTLEEFWEKTHLKSVYRERLLETKKHYPDKTPSLNKTKREFFNDSVVKYFVHDDIHRVIAYRDRPLYEYCQREEVLCDKALFLALSYEDKLNMVREEALVIGLERKLIPKWIQNIPCHYWYTDAFMYGIMRICTTLCRGWFREFAQMNYPAIINCDFKGKFNEFFEAANLGKIERLDNIYTS